MRSIFFIHSGDRLRLCRPLLPVIVPCSKAKTGVLCGISGSELLGTHGGTALSQNTASILYIRHLVLEVCFQVYSAINKSAITKYAPSQGSNMMQLCLDIVRCRARLAGRSEVLLSLVDLFFTCCRHVISGLWRGDGSHCHGSWNHYQRVSLLTAPLLSPPAPDISKSSVDLAT